jgi:hypothetical protein
VWLKVTLACLPWVGHTSALGEREAWLEGAH